MKIEAPGQMGTPTNSNNHEPTRPGRRAHINIELFKTNRYYRCIVLARLAWEAERDVDRMEPRALFQRLWAEGGDAAAAAKDELHMRWYGRVRVDGV